MKTVVIIAALLLAACGGQGSRPAPAPDRPAATTTTERGAVTPSTSGADSPAPGEPAAEISGASIDLDQELAELDRILIDLDRAMAEMSEGFTTKEGDITP